MKGRKQRTLKSFTHRVLALRLALTGILIALVFGLAAYFAEKNRVSDEVIALAIDAVDRFNEEYGYLLEGEVPSDEEAIRKAVEGFRKRPIRLKSGFFVYATLYRKNHEVFSEFRYEDFERIDEVGAAVKAATRVFPERKETFYDVLDIDGAPFIRVVVPFVNPSGEQIGFLESVFTLSRDLLASVRAKVLRDVVAVIVIVLVTTVLLYPVIISLTRRLAGFSADLLESNLGILKTLGSAVAKRDTDTSAHNARVTIISVRIAEAMGLSSGEIQGLIKGAFLHDVGKIGISDNILLKPGKLTDEEFQVMMTHVGHGKEIVGRSKWLNDALNVVAFHHEKVNGKGYLEGLKGEEIPVTARIFSVADVFDALTSRRPYKEPFSFEKTMQILEEGRGTHFDASVLYLFSGIARSLYDNLAGREDDALVHELEGVIKSYFNDEVRAVRLD